MDEGIARVFKRQQEKTSLGTKFVGSKIYAYDLVTSTNDLAHFLAHNNEPEGSVIFAKGQTQGKGRLGKSWVSPYGKGLYFSFILRPDMPVEQASRITLTMALAVATALTEMHIEGVRIKWPNDVLLGEKKVCGILTELSLLEDKVNYIVVGVGLNVNMEKGDLPQDAISLKGALGREFDIADLSHIIIKKIDHFYALLLQHRFTDIIQKVKEYSGLILGGRVKVAWEDREVEGYAVDFDENGSLIIRRDNGFLEKVSSGHLIRLG